MTRLQPTSTLQDAIFKDHVMQQKMAAYTHCELCRRHHSEGRRHIYQKKHKERLKEVLEKFSEKAGITQLCVCVCVCVCVPACVRACVRACVWCTDHC